MKPSNEQSTGIYILNGTIRDYTCQTRQTCPDCGGIHTCPQCDGKGKFECNYCNGQGDIKCDLCDGTGNCQVCHGSGKVQCKSCYGNRVSPTGEVCRDCNGHGYLICGNCDRFGHCPKCNSANNHSRLGRLDCPKCGRTGRITCKACKGQGTCSRCDSDGTIQCQRCQGSGNYQTFKAFQATSYSKYKSLRPTLISSVDPDDVGGQMIYSGTTSEWSNGLNMRFSNGVQVQADCLKQMSMDEKDQFIKHLDMLNAAKRTELAPNSSNDRPWQTNLEVKRIPVTTVRFTVDGKPYSVRLIGQGSYMAAEAITPLPQEIESLKMTSSDERHMRNASPKKRAKAFMLLGEYISRNIYKDDEWKTKNDLPKHISSYCVSGPKDKDKLHEYICEGRRMTQYGLVNALDPLLHSKKTLAFIWQCISIDHQPNERSMDLLHSVAKAMNLGEQDIKATKSMAIGISKLPGEEAAKEYVEPDRDTRGTRACMWTFLLIVAGIIFGIVYGAKRMSNYYHNDYLPNRALTHHRTCNRLAQEALDNNDFKTAHYYLTAYCHGRTHEDKNARKVAETVVNFVDKAMHTAYAGNPADNPLIPLTVDVFLAFNESTFKVCQEECNRMRVTLVQYFLEQNDFISANKVMTHADVESQIYFTDSALAYCMKAGDTKLANRYYKASMNYLRKALYGADLAPFEKRWKKIMQEAKPEKNYKADSRVIALLKAKIQQNGELLRWIE